MDWVARRRDWRQFFRLAARAGRITGSAYHEALLLDPVVAKHLEQMPRDKHPQLFRFDATLHRLTDIADILYKTAVAQAGGDVENANLSRPLTAIDHARLVKRQTAMDRAIATWFPKHTALTPKLTS